MNQTFRPAELDTAHRIVTASMFVLLAFFTVGALRVSNQVPGLWEWVPALVIALVMWISWQIRGRTYEVSDAAITVVRGWPFRDIVIPRSQVRVIRPVKLPWTTARTLGVGGLFGSGGWFSNRELGSFLASFTNGHKLVFIDAGGRYVISPESPEEFMAEVKKINQR